MERQEITYIFLIFLLAIGWIFQALTPVALHILHKNSSHEVAAYCTCDKTCTCMCTLPHGQKDANIDSGVMICSCNHASDGIPAVPAPEFDKARIQVLDISMMFRLTHLMLFEDKSPISPITDRLFRPPRYMT